MTPIEIKAVVEDEPTVMVLKLDRRGAAFIAEYLDRAAPDDLVTQRVRRAVEQAQERDWRRP